jgi:hypothetical protein
MTIAQKGRLAGAPRALLGSKELGQLLIARRWPYWVQTQNPWSCVPFRHRATKKKSLLRLHSLIRQSRERPEHLFLLRRFSQLLFI